MLALKDSKGGTNEYKPSTLPPQVISLGIKGKYLSATNSIEVNVVFNNIAQNALIYLQDYILTYKKNSIPENPFDGKQELIPKVTSTTVSHTFNLPADYLGNVGFRVFPKNPDKMYQTANIPDVNSLMATFKKFVKPTFTGSHAYFSDANYEWMECYGGGTLIADGTFDVCVIGSGGNSAGKNSSSNGLPGAGAGYIDFKKLTLSGNYIVVIGSNGTGSALQQNGKNLLFGQPGKSNHMVGSIYGGNGSSGGGDGSNDIREHDAGDGGTNGSNGRTWFGDQSKGKGVGNPPGTHLFLDSKFKLLGGGGGGGGSRFEDEDTGERRKNSPGKGGVPGGGNGYTYNNYDAGTPGTPNSGGGSGGGNNAKGGSGLFAIRWRKAV